MRSQAADSVFTNRPLEFGNRTEAVSVTDGAGISCLPLAQDKEVDWVVTVSNVYGDGGLVVTS